MTTLPPVAAEVGSRPSRSGRASSLDQEPTRAAAAPAAVPRLTWLAIYLVAIVGPFILISLGEQRPARTFTHELGSSLGIVVLVLFALQLVLPARLRLFAPLGAEVAVRLHRRLTTVVLTLTAAHILVIVLADPARLALFRFVDAPWRAQAGMLAVLAMLVLIVTSLFRRRIRLSYATWRGIHLVLGGLALALAVAHTVAVGGYLSSGPAVIVLSAVIVVPFASVAALRLTRLRPTAVLPYLVTRVVPEGGGVTSLHLDADGHGGQPFSPGQFAWIRLEDGRSSLAEHPFSYVSSARRAKQPSFAIRAHQGFTAQVPSLEAGTRVLVDGPHGSFRYDKRAPGLLLVAGGIGITPAMSILQTAWDDRSTGSFLLLYAGRNEAALTFMDRFPIMGLKLDLRVVPVLSDPEPGWTGESGRLRPEIIDRYLPDDVRRWQFAVCGPPGLVDATIAALAALDIPPERIHAERFVEV